MSTTRIVLENVPWNHDVLRQSFEEVRAQDYLKAYQTTGRPPLPCPQEPADEATRSAMGLPPLFKPFIEESGSAGEVELGVADQQQKEPPHPQVWEPTTVMEETFQSLTAQSAFMRWSFEELRVRACLQGSGHLYVPPAVATTSTFSPLRSQSSTSSLATTSTTLLQSYTSDPREKLENISTRPGYEGHSPEEHRIAFMLSGRELTSAEIGQAQGGRVPVPAVTPVGGGLGNSGGGGVGGGGGSGGGGGGWLGQNVNVSMPQLPLLGGVSTNLFAPAQPTRPPW